ncbi:MAG: hypothetical protein S4CHLAM20_14420 [Chlamydiia bacterium]|nr:hypothetical protein [Chlamydiia bacterium]
MHLLRTIIMIGLSRLLFMFSFLLTFAFEMDVVIPVHKKDVTNLAYVIASLRKNIKDIRNIYVVSKENYCDAGIWVAESDFPFSIEDVSEQVGNKGGIGGHPYRGWFYQQILKFYAPFVIEGILDHVLIFDSDTCPNHEMSFISDEGKVFLDVVMSETNFQTYNDHMIAIFPELKDFETGFNPVNHHIVFSKDILEDLFSRAEDRFQKPFWKIFLNQVTMKYGLWKRGFQLSASEYTIYTHYCLHYHRKKVELRDIKVHNFVRNLSKKYPQHIDFISKHNQNR